MQCVFTFVQKKIFKFNHHDEIAPEFGVQTKAFNYFNLMKSFDSICYFQAIDSLPMISDQTLFFIEKKSYMVDMYAGHDLSLMSIIDTDHNTFV